MGIKVELIVPCKVYSKLLIIIRQHKEEYNYARIERSIIRRRTVGYFVL